MQRLETTGIIAPSRLLGNHGLGDRNENGELLVDFAAANDLIVGGSLFAYLDIHKYSWISSDGLTKNQIDHCLVSRKWRSSLIDVRSYRGADVGSDHSLMMAKFKIKLRRNTKKTPRPDPLFDSDKLLNKTLKHDFVVELSNRFQALSQPEQLDQEHMWKDMKTCFQSAASEILG